MKFKEIALQDGKQGGATQGIGILEDGTAVWVIVHEKDQVSPATVIRSLEVRDLKIVDKREPTPTGKW